MSAWSRKILFYKKAKIYMRNIINNVHFQAIIYELNFVIIKKVMLKFFKNEIITVVKYR